MTPRPAPPARLLLSRRGVLLGAAGTAFLVACGGDDGSASGTTAGGSATTLGADSIQLTPLFNPGVGYLQTEMEQRLTWALFDFQGAPVAEYPPELEWQLFFDGVPTEDNPELLHEPLGLDLTSPLRAVGIPRPYYEFRYTPEQAGLYTAETTVDGQSLSRQYQVQLPDEVDLVQIGGEMVPVQTATFDNHLDMSQLCTLEPEPCPFHEESLTRPLEEGRPVAFLISTPQFCQVGICGPVLELLVETQSDYPDIAFVHTEVYTNADEVENIQAATLAEPVEAYGLTFEPSLFIAGADGICADRLDNIYDNGELREGLDKVA